MADALSGLSGLVPSKASVISFGTTTFSTITILIVVGVFVIVAAILGYIIIQRMKYNKRIVIFEKIGNRWQQTGRDAALEFKYGMAGDTVFYLRKRKKYLPRPELQMSPRTFWFAIREDGEWINVDIEDIDTTMKQAKAHFLHPEMRYARTAMLRNLKDRYDKPKFFEKYGAMIINFAAIVIILVFMWLIIDKIVSVSGNINQMAVTGKEVMEAANRVLAGLDNICSSSGIVR